ncbi:30S ribosomal protein S13 [archaeon]|nr:30S ribosomal protein S13 [archaeon]|tara:strand:- start:367 stop:891 length:525 start_codon:yes stop_codon:yes gene_type:complete
MGDKGNKNKKDTKRKKDLGKPAPEKQAPKKRRVQNIVRIMSADLDANFSVYNALRHVKGISFRVSGTVLTNTDIDPRMKLSEMSPEQIKIVENAVAEAKFPAWMKNAPDKHIVMSDIDLQNRNDINLLQKTRAYRGIRHERGLPVRGQRTRGSFRKNKTVGVVKKKAIQSKGGK